MVTAADKPEKQEEPEDADVDLDLEAEDAELRSEIGKGTTVRLTGGVTITIPHMDSWEYAYSRAMATGDFTTWAAGVLSEDDFSAWVDAKLKNYQITQIIAKVTINAGVGSLGKSGRRSPSSRRRKGR